MNFREMFLKYKSGDATPEERAVVEQELEKFEILNEYMAEDTQKSLTDSFSNDIISGSASAVKVKKTINRKFILTAVISVAIVIVTFLFVFFGLSPLMDSLNYQPLKSLQTDMPGEMQGPPETKLLIDTVVFTELHFPGYITYSADADSLGFGNYDIKLTQWDIFKSTFDVYTGKIENGKMKYLASNFFKYPFVNAFHFGVYPFDDFRQNGDNAEVEEIRKLPATAVVKASISFNNDLSLDDLTLLISKYESLNFIWVGVRSCAKDVQQLPQLGFEPSGSGIIIEENAVDREKYPYLELAWSTHNSRSSEILETHFKSLLKYMVDNVDYPLLGSPNNVYPKTLKYVEDNGVKTYGCLVLGNGSDVLALRSNPNVDSIMLDDVKVSSYSK
jgi:hypothetical protein